MNIAEYALPVFIAVVLIYGTVHKIDVFESFIKGARKGLSVALRILPYIVAMIFAVDIFSAGGGFEILSAAICTVVGSSVPTEIIPLALLAEKARVSPLNLQESEADPATERTLLSG